jgi:hypothetical protein
MLLGVSLGLPSWPAAVKMNDVVVVKGACIEYGCPTGMSYDVATTELQSSISTLASRLPSVPTVPLMVRVPLVNALTSIMYRSRQLGCVQPWVNAVIGTVNEVDGLLGVRMIVPHGSAALPKHTDVMEHAAQEPASAPVQ